MTTTTTSPFPLVTVAIPVLDEEGTIEACLAAVAAQDWPAQRMEVLVVDGGSTDGTVEHCREALRAAGYCRAAVIPNHPGIRPANLNRALVEAAGEIFCRVDARSRVPAGYVRTCAELLSARPEVAVVGGAQVAVPPRPGPVGQGIARALNNRLGTGLARYRRHAGRGAAASGPADTVYLGAFRTAQLRQVGGWRTDLPVNEDFDLNRRMVTAGKVWFDGSLAVAYEPRRTLGGLWRQYRAFGEGKARYWAHSGDRPQARQLLLLAVPPVTAALAAATVLAAAIRGWPFLAGSLAAATALALAVEHGGRPSPPAGIRGRLVAVATLATVTAGWLSGVWSGLAAAVFRPARRSRPAEATTVITGSHPRHPDVERSKGTELTPESVSQ
jgi:hypothetical protein